MGGDHQPAARLSRGLLHLFYCDAHSSEFQLKSWQGHSVAVLTALQPKMYSYKSRCKPTLTRSGAKGTRTPNPLLVKAWLPLRSRPWEWCLIRSLRDLGLDFMR